MKRLSRPCWDKPHRCPGWAGGGLKYPKVDRCKGGSIRTRTPRPWPEGGFLYPAEDKWRFGHCTKCNVVTIPWALRKLDPRYWWSELTGRLL